MRFKLYFSHGYISKSEKLYEEIIFLILGCYHVLQVSKVSE